MPVDAVFVLLVYRVSNCQSSFLVLSLSVIRFVPDKTKSAPIEKGKRAKAGRITEIFYLVFRYLPRHLR